MSDSPAPSHLIGRVGMVAMVERVRAHAPGRLVVLQEPAGLLTDLVDSPTPVFGWQCHLLGEPVQIDGKARRDLHVPDHCLTPISHLTQDQIRQLTRDHASQDFDRTLADLGRILSRTSMSASDLERSVDRAAIQWGIERCLETVSAAQALRDAGFRQHHPDGNALRWVVANGDVQLILDADQDLCGHWMVSSRGRSSREIYCDETRLPPDGARGLLLRQVLGLWRSAFGDAPVPDGLSPAVIYGQHQAAIGRAVRPPQLRVDPQVFRAVRRWLTTRFNHLDRATPVRFSHLEAMLRIEVDGVAFGCPAQGVWVHRCSVDLGNLLSIDAWVLRQRSLTLEMTPDRLEGNGWPLRATLT